MHDMTVDQSLLDESVRRIVGVAHLDRIILFGSAACGEMRPDR
jgi:predicted nucleotidyltransferase